MPKVIVHYTSLTGNTEEMAEDAGYPIYCGAVDFIENKLRDLGVSIVCDGLKFEYNASNEEKEQGKGLGALVAGALCRS